MEKRNRKYSNFYVSWVVVVILLVLCSAYIVAANQPPVADADPDYQTVYVGEEAWFTGNKSYDPDGYIVSYYWDFGLGICLSGETISFVFNCPGIYKVTLTVIDDDGDTATDTVIVNVIEEPPQPDEPVVWIESLTTDKQVYDINETVNATVIVVRGDDPLTYVWEGTLTLEVFDDTMVIVYDDDREVYLPTGGATQTFYFEFILTELGDYLVRATLYDIDNIQVDIEETCITVGEEPPGGILFVWIDFLSTDKQVYNITELVSTTVIVKRGKDMLTYVWEGTLTLEVFDDAMDLVYDEDQGVYLPYGGATETHYFEFVLTEPGDYLVRATLYDMNNIQVDIEETCITVGEEPPGGILFVWIDSLTTDKQVYNINELVSTTVIVKRGNDNLNYVWEGTLTLKVYNDATVLVYTEDQGAYLPCGGTTETHYFEFVLTEPGEYLVRAVLYDKDNKQADLEDICITVTEEPSGGNSMVWIESLTTDKQGYGINELVSITVVVERGDDMLTYVWEGTLTLEIFDDDMVLVYTDDREVYLPSGGMTETHNFEYTATESDDYLVRATLYDFNDILVDVEETCITVSEEPGDGLGIHHSEGSEAGLFEGNGGWLIALALIGATVIALLAFATIHGPIKIRGRKK
jgi:hypothetical protein